MLKRLRNATEYEEDEDDDEDDDEDSYHPLPKTTITTKTMTAFLPFKICLKKRREMQNVSNHTA